MVHWYKRKIELKHMSSLFTLQKRLSATEPKAEDAVSSSLLLSLPLNFNYFSGCVIYCCGFNLNLPNDLILSTFSCVYGHLCSFIYVMFVQIICPIKMSCLIFYYWLVRFHYEFWILSERKKHSYTLLGPSSWSKELNWHETD